MNKKSLEENNLSLSGYEILDHLPDIFLMVDNKGIIVLVNATVEEVLGWKPYEITGVSMDVLLPPEHRSHHGGLMLDYFSRPTEKGMNERLDLYAWHKQGYTVPVDIKLSHTDFDNKTYGIAIVRGNSPHRILEKKLEEQNKRLETLVEEKNNLLGIAAHDLRNPIGVIQNFSEIMQSGSIGPLTNDQEEFIQRINQSSVFMREMLEDILDFSSIESGTMNLRMSNFSMCGMVDDVLAANKIHAKSKSIEIHIEKDTSKDVQLNADKGKLHQVVQNLIDNAIKYSPNSSNINIKCLVKDNILNFSVGDEGVGIPEKDIAHLFNPFFRAGNKPTAGEKSTGLGLYISKRIIDAHGGKLEVESEDGKGSTFRFKMPLNK